MTATCPLALDHPHLRAFLDAGDRDPCVDWLLDQGLTLSDAARLYAGTAANAYEDGLPQDWLARWLEVSGRGADAGAVRGCVLEQYRGRMRRSDATGRYDRGWLACVLEWDVRDRCRREVAGFGEWALTWGAVTVALSGAAGGREEGDALLRVAREELARARRDLKRRVLSLPAFRGVSEAREYSVDADDVGRPFGVFVRAMVFLPRGGLRPDLPWSRSREGRGHWAHVRYAQAVPAAEFVPLDSPEELRRMPDEAVLANEVIDFPAAVKQLRWHTSRALGLPPDLLA